MRIYIFIIILFLNSGCIRLPYRDTTRTDYYDLQSNHTGYSVKEGTRVDYYDLNSNRTGYSYEE